MGLLQRFFGRKSDHEAWLADHPGKDSKPAPPMAISADEEQRTRSQMEGELTDQRNRREER